MPTTERSDLRGVWGHVAPTSKPWLTPQHEAGAARPAASGVPRAALTGPPTAAVAAVPLRVSGANSVP